MAHEAEDLQYAADIMRISMEKVLEKDPSSRMVLLHAVEVVLASPFSLSSEERLPQDIKEHSISQSTSGQSESSEENETAATPHEQVSVPVDRVPGTYHPTVSFMDTVMELSKSVTPKKNRTPYHSLASADTSDPFASPSVRHIHLTEKNTELPSINKGKKSSKV